jgi:sec-independent protein translocase protein TatC
MSRIDRNQDSEDLFAETRMTFGEHLEDLRVHLWRALIGFLIALVVGFFVGYWVLEFIAHPVTVELNRFYDERAEGVKKKLQEGTDDKINDLNKPQSVTIELNLGKLAEALGINVPEGKSEHDWVQMEMRIPPVALSVALAKSNQLVSRRFGLSTLSPQESLMAYIKVSFISGLVLGSPWIFTQLWAFVAAGLYPHEKRLVNVYLPISVALFLGGVLVCQFLVIPKALQALLWFNHWLDLEPDIRFNEWLGFAIMLPVIFGVSFQLPMLMLFLERIGVMSVDSYIAKWRIACFLIHVFAAAVTPVDIFSMESLALTMCGLYGLGIFLCWMNPTPKKSDTDIPDSEEMVEV